MVSTSTTTDPTTLSATLTNLLKQADINGDGIVAQSELQTAIGSDSSVATEMVSAADANGDGAMSGTEFASFAEKFSTQTGMALLNAQESTAAVGALYAALDTNGSGSLTATEMTTAVAAAAAAEAAVDSTTSDSGSESTASDTSTDDDAADTDTSSASGSGSNSSAWDDLLAEYDVTGDGVINKDDMAIRMLKAAQDKEAEKADENKLDDTIAFIREQLAALLNQKQSS